MDFKTISNDECFEYSVFSEQVLGTLYKVRKGKDLNTFDNKYLINAKDILTNIVAGNSFELDNTDINTLTNDRLFIYDYGSSALKTIEKLSEDQELLDYVKNLISIIDNIDKSNNEEIKSLEKFFNAIGQLLDEDMENVKYQNAIANQDIFDYGGQFI